MRSIRTARDALTVVLTLGSAALFGAPFGCDEALFAPLPGAGADAAPRRGGTLHLASAFDIRNLDPAGPADGLATQAVQLLFAGIVDYDEAGRLVPDLAEHWEVDDGGRTYRFVLRQGVRMHDGDEVTADDVKRSAERALHPSAPNPSASSFEDLRGYAAFTANGAEHLDGIVVEGRYVVSFRLAEPDAAFLPRLAMQTLRPVCKSAGDRYVDTWLPCGAGPFKLEAGDWQRGTSLRVVRHEGYFRPGLPYLEAVEWTFNMQLFSQRFRFEDGELDLLHEQTQADAARFLADPRWKSYSAVGADTEVWGEAMNTRMPPFDNVEVRRAVAAAIDREHYAMLKPANMAPLTQLLPRSVPGYDPTFEGQRHDHAAALEHMRKAGFPYDPTHGAKGWPKPIPYTLTDNSTMAFTAQLLQQDLAQIGLRIELRLMSWPAFLAITSRPGASAMSQQGWGLDYLDASNFFDPLFSTSALAAESSTNKAFYSNPDFDDLVARARRELTPTVRNALYRQANEILCDEAPWAFAYGIHRFDIHQPYVRGYKPHPVWQVDVSRVWLDRTTAPLRRRLGMWHPR